MDKKIITQVTFLAFFAVITHINNLFCLDSKDIKKIGSAIWYNEAGSRKDLLAFWSEHEPFPSLGIGHAIWFPEGAPAPYTEQFPLLCDFLEKNKVKLPGWLKVAKKTGAPWKTRQEFMQDVQKREQLITLLSSTIELQTRFMIERFAFKRCATTQQKTGCDLYYSFKIITFRYVWAD
jgi:hypothetical protein